jgi:ribosomal protein S18 acetylase RimI-like enzyme
MKYVIRRARVEDAPGIAKVHVETWQAHYRGQVPDDFLARLSVENRTTVWAESLLLAKPNYLTLVAEEDGVIVGFCDVGPSRDPDASETIGEMNAIYVRPSEHRRGIGLALMNEALRFLHEGGFTEATLWVLRTNLSTIKFYEANGWIADGGEKKESRADFTFDEIRYRTML